MAEQRCPACNMLHNVGIYVSGQHVRCSNCGLPFVVVRCDSVVLAGAVVKEGGDDHARTVNLQANHTGHTKRELPLKREPSCDLTMAGKQERRPVVKPKAMPVVSEVLSIPGYRFYGLLGKGGMGRVYRARQESLHRMVAIKVLNEDLAKRGSFIRRFEKESGALAALSHPNIVTVIDRGHFGATYFFVMEYIAGPSLRARMNRGALKIQEAVELMVMMCRAVEHAHHRGVIHRDLKPENVLFTSEGELKIADFGLANIMRPERHWELTRTKVSMGTTNYMAPEQRQDAKHVDHRADIYSLGVIFYEMLAGELPLGRFDPPSHHHEKIDQRIDKLVLKMLDSSPDKRPQRAELVASFLLSIEQVDSQSRFNTFYRRASSINGRIAREQAPTVVVSDEHGGEAGSVGSHHPRLSSKLLTIAGGLLLLVLATIGIVALLFYQDLDSSYGDLVYHRVGDRKHLKVSHQRQVKYLAPSTYTVDRKKKLLVIDFMPSSLPPVPVTLLGGSWELERGSLVQDTTRHAFVINQVPARALLGSNPIRISSGVKFKLNMAIQYATYTSEQGQTFTMEEYMKEYLGAFRVMLPVQVVRRVGLGVMDKRGTGLELLVDVHHGEKAWLVRSGEEMEKDTSLLQLANKIVLGDGIHMFTFAVSQGRVRTMVNDRLIADELAGFPLGFEGLPMISCQNMRCNIRSIEVASP